MTYGFSRTKTVGAPIGTSGMFGQGPAMGVVPLSVFFLDAGDADGDGEQIYGYRRKDDKKPSKAPKARKGQAHAKTKNGREGGAQSPPQSGSGAGELTPGKEAAKGQSTAPATEAIGLSPSRPGAPSKLGASRETSGAMGSGNVAQYPVPIGPPLRRTWPEGPRRKRKKKKMTQEQREQWARRLGSLCTS